MSADNQAERIAKSAADGSDVTLLGKMNTETLRATVYGPGGEERRVEFYEDTLPGELGSAALSGYWMAMDAAHVVTLEEMA